MTLFVTVVFRLILLVYVCSGKPKLKEDWFNENQGPKERRGFQWQENFDLNKVQDPEEFKKFTNNFDQSMPPDEFSNINREVVSNKFRKDYYYILLR